MIVAIVGLGLIGGSIARALRAAPSAAAWTILGWSPSDRTRRAALDAAAVDRVVPFEDAIREAELIVLAAPPLACLGLLDQLGGPLRDGIRPEATITDVASTKSQIVARADDLGLRFVGGHPMAGRETSGFEASEADLFVDRPWIIVPGAASGSDDLDRVTELAGACGARPLAMDAATHDAAVAAISHLPLVVSTALTETVCGTAYREADAAWAAAAPLAAGGWRDTTRVARGDPAMGAGILATNAGQVAERLHRLRVVLDEWIGLLEEQGDPDPVALEARFEAARRRLMQMPAEARR